VQGVGLVRDGRPIRGTLNVGGAFEKRMGTYFQVVPADGCTGPLMPIVSGFYT